MDIGHYTLLGQVPAGRYGAIWHARDDQSGLEVALKQLALATPDRWPAIQQMAATLAQVQHPNLARTAAPVENADGLWLVEEWLGGASFDGVLSAPSLNRAQALGVVHSALEGLAELHRRMIAHGTVSPETIVVTTDGVPKLVDVGAFLGQPEAAGLNRYASPEAHAGRQLAPQTDVFSAAAVMSSILDRFGSLTGEVQQVLQRATSADPSQRQPDAAVLLMELDPAGERTFGAGWWTTEGIAAVVASTTGATLATAGSVGAGSGGAGAVSGSVTVPGGGAVGGANTTAGGAAARVASKGRGPLIAVGAGVVTLAVVAAGAYAITATRKGSTAPPVTSTTAGGPGQSPSLPPPTPTPTATPKPVAQGFTGTYTYEAVVTKTNWPGVKVGDKAKRTWIVRTTCVGDKCTSAVKPNGSSAFSLDSKAGTWNTTSTSQAQCVDTRTHRPINQKVPIKYTRTMKVAERSGDLVTKITGKARSAQAKKCRNQPTPLVYEDWKITITYVKS
jgi:serine/threonine protein kinase